MSLRPPKHSDQKKLKEAMRKKERIIEEKNKLPPHTLIICEGIKTEPYYIQGLVDLVNEKYSEFIKTDRIKVFGTGRNTRGLLKYARKYASKPENKQYSRIWLVYDKDDFPNDNFDNTQFSIDGCNDEDKSFFAAWSNESIELWFVLYFQELTANVSRDQYIDILKGYFNYEKTLTNLYKILEEKGNLNLAVSRARKLYEENHDSSPSKMAPATKVYELVEELKGYLH